MKTFVDSLTNYFPKHSGLHNYESSLLLMLKDNYDYPKVYFFNLICKWIEENIDREHTVCVAPSSRSSNPIKYLVSELCYKYFLLKDGTELIRNKYLRTPIHLCNYRGKQIVKNSIAVSSDVAGKHILLLDDICTTGTTMAAIEEKLLESGALSVHCLAIGKTARIFERA